MSSQPSMASTASPANDNPLETVLRPLTGREREILLGILDGESVKETARRLRVSPKTVEFHRTRAFEKTGFRTATETLVKLGSRQSSPASLRNATVEPSGRRQPDTNPGRRSAHGKGQASVNLIEGLRYARQIDPDLITVLMAWTCHGTAVGYVVLPASLEALAENLQYPPTIEPIPLEGAVAYGLYLSLRTSVPMCLSGDATAWNKVWGRLPGTDAAG